MQGESHIYYCIVFRVNRTGWSPVCRNHLQKPLKPMQQSLLFLSLNSIRKSSIVHRFLSRKPIHMSHYYKCVYVCLMCERAGAHIASSLYDVSFYSDQPIRKKLRNLNERFRDMPQNEAPDVFYRTYMHFTYFLWACMQIMLR